MPIKKHWQNKGFTLIETLIFIVVISIGLTGVLSVYFNTVGKTLDPLVQLRAMELAQTQLDEILSRKYDRNTPTGGFPACSSSPPICDAFNPIDEKNCDDVDDFSSPFCSLKPSYKNYKLKVDVKLAGTGKGNGFDLPLLASEDAAKLITVTVTTPGNVELTFSSYRVNF